MTDARVSVPDEKEIKEIPDIPEQVFKAASNGKLVVFLGAGVSRIIGCPSWQELASLQLRQSYEKKALNYHEYTNLKPLDARKLLLICRQIYTEKNISPQNLKSLLGGNKELTEKFTIFDDLYAFNAVYVTTNYDDHLDRVAQKHSCPVKVKGGWPVRSCWLIMEMRNTLINKGGTSHAQARYRFFGAVKTSPEIPV